jgi:hypothetical protein
MRHRQARLPRAAPALSTSDRPGHSSSLTFPSPGPSVHVSRRRANVTLLRAGSGAKAPIPELAEAAAAMADLLLLAAGSHHWPAAPLH